jgi:glycosyltransferase involved in cell wall biosynthesis
MKAGKLMKNKPLISCLCVTRKRIELLKRAIACFVHQTYPNKELVIIFEDDDSETEKYAATLIDKRIHCFKVGSDPKLTLGALRNISINKSKGEYFCQWDDDDWYHCERLSFQMNALEISKKKASVLAYWLMYDTVRKEAYLSFPTAWAGSLLCKKKVENDNILYPDLSKGEDLNLLLYLIHKNYLIPLIAPSLYIYTNNGNNTWSRDHFEQLCSSSQKLSKGATLMIKGVLENKYNQVEASQLLFKKKILEEINFFHSEIQLKKLEISQPGKTA